MTHAIISLAKVRRLRLKMNIAVIQNTSALSAEALELLEIFQWLTEEQSYENRHRRFSSALQKKKSHRYTIRKGNG